MAEKTSDGKFVPVLALLVLLLLGVSAGWIWMLESQKSAAPEETALSRFALAQNVSIEVSEALQGKADSFRNLSALQLSVSQSGAASMNAIRIALPMVLAAESDLQSLQRSGQRVAVLLPAFVDAVYKLEGQLALQRQPTAVAHLGRLRLLGQLMANDLSALARGDGDATDLIQRATNTEMELSQIIAGLLIGDPKLVIQQITDVGAQATVNELSAISEQLSLELSDIVDSSQRLEPVFAAAAEAKSSAAAMGSKGSTSTVTAVNGGLASELLPPLTVLGLAAALLLIMLFSYFRGAGRRAVTAELAMQAGRDEEAILRMLDELGNLADGDLTSQLTVTEDITGAIADSINYAVEALRELVTTIKESTIMVDSATKQSEVSARRLDETQAGQLRQIKLASEAITAMNVSIDEVSGDAERSADVARHSVDVAHKGGAAVRRTIEGMNTIRETIQETSKRIKRLGESSQEIGNIVELINDIAEQTNILALNASIQASMAGEAGRGFAVVADEVQRLAERSTNATKQIEVLVRTIQSDTNEAVVSMERSTTDVVGGALLAENAGAALEEIEQVSNQIAMLVQNISNSAREQAVAAQGVKKNMGELTEIGNSTVENASSTTDSIKKLGQLATQLRKSVAGFRLPESFSETAVLERVNFEGLQTKDTVTAEPKDADVIDQHSA